MYLKMLAFFAATSWVAWLILFAGLQTKRESRQRSETERARASGTIVEYARGEQPSGRHGSRAYWKPVVEFTAEGQTCRAEYPNRMDRERFPAGTEVVILYDPRDPSRFHLEEDPVFTDPGGGAIRMSVIWIIACAVLTLVLAVFVGGLRIDLRMLEVRLRRLFRHR